MESLALLVAIIIAPAMFGGPIALALSFWRIDQVSRGRSLAIKFLSAISIAIGLYLLIGNVSRGAIYIGALGCVSGAMALWRLRG